MTRLAPGIRVTRACGHSERISLPHGATVTRWALVLMDAKAQECARCRAR